MTEVPVEAMDALHLGAGESALDAWHAWLWERVYVRRGFRPPRSLQTQFREGFLVLTSERLVFVTKPLLERNYTITLSLGLDSQGIKYLAHSSEDLTVDRWNFRIKHVDLGEIANTIKQAMAQRGGRATEEEPDFGDPPPGTPGPQPLPEGGPKDAEIPGVTTEYPEGFSPRDTALPRAASPEPASAGVATPGESVQEVSCPECHELTPADKPLCAKCGADISWMQ